MPVYKYTIKKYAKSYSTWVITITTAIIIFFVSGILPFVIWPPEDIDQYSKTILILIPNVTIFLSIFTSVFSGFKSATMFKDEVEDGTFLIILSKPIPRTKILIYKWLALQTFLFFYAIFSSFCFAVVLAIFDVGHKIEIYEIKTLRENFFVIFGFISIILYVMSLTFSSIAIFLSTKFSVSSTVGISIALGIVIPITSLIRTFTHNQENLLLTTKSRINTFYNKISKDNMKNGTSPNQKTINSISDNINKYKKQYGLFLNDPGINDFANRFDSPEKVKNEFNEHKKTLDSLSSSPDNYYNLSILLDNKNHYKKLWFFDTNFQIRKLTSLVYDEIISPDIQDSLTIGLDHLRTANYNSVIKYDIFNKKNEIKKSIEKFDRYIEFSWQKTKKIRSDLMFLWLFMIFKNRDEIQQNFNKLLPSSFLYDELNKSFSYIMQKFDESNNENNEKFNLNNLNFYKYFFETINIIKQSSKQRNLKQIQKIIPFLLFAESAYNSTTYKSNVFKLKNKTDNLTFNYLTKYLEDLFSPIDILLKNFHKIKKLDLKFDKFTNKNSIKFRTSEITGEDVIDFEGYKDGIPFTKLYSYYLLRYSKRSINKGVDIDSKILQNLSNKNVTHYWLNVLIASKIQFNQTEKKEYASKYEILIIFLAISILLIPVAYLFVRKKDFR